MAESSICYVGHDRPLSLNFDCRQTGTNGREGHQSDCRHATKVRQPFDSDAQIPALRMCVSAQMSSSCLTYHALRKTTDPVYMLQLSARDFFLNEAVATSYEFR